MVRWYWAGGEGVPAPRRSYDTAHRSPPRSLPPAPAYQSHAPARASLAALPAVASSMATMKVRRSAGRASAACAPVLSLLPSPAPRAPTDLSSSLAGAVAAGRSRASVRRCCSLVVPVAVEQLGS